MSVVVPAVHEEVQQRAEQQQQEWQRPQQVGAMLRPEEEDDDPERGQRAETVGAPPKRPRCRILLYSSHKYPPVLE